MGADRSEFFSAFDPHDPLHPWSIDSKTKCPGGGRLFHGFEKDVFERIAFEVEAANL